MLQLAGFFAWISVDGVELEQHGVEVSEDGKNITCWIISEAGKNFAVEWRDPIRMFASASRVTLDGVICGGRFIRAAADPLSSMTDSDSVKADFVRVTATTRRDFSFSSLELTDDDSYLDASSSQHLGEISLALWRTTIGSEVVPMNFEVPQELKVHERSKKRLDHCVKFGEEMPLVAKTMSVENWTEEPFATFTFKYRSLDILQANRIIPLPPSTSMKREASASPEPDVNEESDEDPDLDEARVLEERLNAIREKLKKKGKGKKLKRVKLEPHAGRPSVAVPCEVIDLT